MFRGILAFYLQSEAIRGYNHLSKVKEQQHLAVSSILPLSCFYPLLYVLLSLSELENVWGFFFSLLSSEMDLKH